MPYPYYTPYNYNPYNYSYQPQPIVPPVQQTQNSQPVPNMQQPVQQQSSQPNNQLQNGGLVEVRDYSEVQQWPVAPGNVVTFIKYDRSEMYTKTASHNQFEAPVISTFIITRKDEPILSNNSSETPYAMKKDVEALAGIVKGFDSMIASIKCDIEKMSGDLYGIAGKKKTAPSKKTEETEE